VTAAQDHFLAIIKDRAMLLAMMIQAARSGTPFPGSLPPFLHHLTLSTLSAELNEDQELELVCTGVGSDGLPYDISGDSLTWESDTPAAATVDAAGLVTGQNVGADTPVVITVTHDDSGLSVECELLIKDVAAPAVCDELEIYPPGPFDAFVLNSSWWFQATPKSGGVEFPVALTWEEVGASGIVTFSATGADSYRHMKVTGASVGPVQIRARAVGAGAGGVDVLSDLVDITVVNTPSQDTPNLPGDMLEIAEWQVGPSVLDFISGSSGAKKEIGYGIPYPVNTPNAAGYSCTANDYQRLALIADPSAPGGYVVRVYFLPSFPGGGGPDHIGVDFAVGAHGTRRYKEIYRAILKRMHSAIHGAVFGILGIKESFIRFPQDANQLQNSTYFNEYGTSNGNMGFNVQGLGTPTPPAIANHNAPTGWDLLNDGSLHLIETILRQQSGSGVIDGEWSHFVDGVLDQQYLTMQFVPAGINPQDYGWEKESRTHTYGGGHDNPPGVAGTGFVGKFVRTGSAQVVPGAVDPTNPRRFIRTSGTFAVNQIAHWYGVKADGTHVGPYDLANGGGNPGGYINPTTLQFPVGANMTGVVCIYRGIEMFNAAAVGQTLTFRSHVLDYHPETNPGGTGLYPIIGSGVVASVGQTTNPGDTVFVTGVDLTGAQGAYGLRGGLDGPLFADFAWIFHAGLDPAADVPQIPTSVSASPPTMNLLPPAGTGQIVPTLLDQNGNAIDGASGWTYASDTPSKATVSGAGLVTGVAVGAAIVTVTHTSSGLSTTVPITVETPAAVVDHVNASPTSLSVVVGGGTATITADPEDASNVNIPGRVVTAVSSDPTKATVSVAGYTVTATPVANGSTNVTISCEGEDVIVPVTVLAAAVENEPQDVVFSTLVDMDLTADSVDSTLTDGSTFHGMTVNAVGTKLKIRDLSDGQSWNTTASDLPVDASLGHSKSLVATVDQAEGDSGKLFISTGGAKTLYFRDRVCISSNWDGHSVKSFKHLEVFVQGHTNNLIAHLFGSGANTIRPNLKLQNTSGDDGSFSGTGSIPRNQRVTLELVVAVQSAIGTADGHATLYIDGVKQVQRTGIDWSDLAGVAGTNFNQVDMLFYRGGNVVGEPAPDSVNYVSVTALKIRKSATRCAVPA
jgi:hypothetical protein